MPFIFDIVTFSLHDITLTKTAWYQWNAWVSCCFLGYTFHENRNALLKLEKTIIKFSFFKVCPTSAVYIKNINFCNTYGWQFHKIILGFINLYLYFGISFFNQKHSGCLSVLNSSNCFQTLTRSYSGIVLQSD